LLGLLLLLIVRTPGETDAALLAYFNCVLGTWAIVFFARRVSVEALIPVLFLPMIIISWPLGSLYFAIFDPDMVYKTKWQVVRILDQNLRLQTASFLFLTGYLPVVFIALRRSVTSTVGSLRNPRRIADTVTIFSTAVILANATSKVVPLPSMLLYFIDGLWIYFQGIIFVTGALFTHISRKVKTYLTIVLPATVLFYTLGNARGMAMVPCALFGFGILFSSELKQKTKLIVLIVGLLSLPAYTVIGNTTRVLGHSIGFQDLDKRWEQLQDWEQVVENASFLGQTFSRLFHVSGQRIVTTTPEKYPYLPFNLLGFASEFFGNLLPRRFYHSAPVYSGNLILLRYGFNVSETTSVEVSLLGSLWLLGGYYGVLFGGTALGLVHTALIAVLRRARRTSGLKPMFLFGVLGGTLIGMSGFDLIHQSRRYVWCLIVGHVFYMALSLFIREPSEAPRRDEPLGGAKLPVP
jgi:hypothetical protein